MNKSLIFVLAICLVSVHAFVKRDAPESAPQQNNYLNDINEKAKEFGADVQKVFQQIADPKKAQDLLDQITAGFNNVVNQLKPNEAPKA